MTAHTPTVRRRSPRHALAILALVASCGILASCDNDDPNQAALATAARKLDTYSAPGSVPHPTEKLRKDTYAAVINGLKATSDGGSPGQQSAANLLIGRSQAGMGEIASQNASDLERRFLSQIGNTRAALDQWVSQNSVADALKVYNPTKDLADLDTQIAARLADAERLQAQRTNQERVVADIKSRADRAATDAKKEREREATLRKTAEGQTQTARLDTITQASVIRRSADKLDEQASNLGAEAAKESPKLDELQREIDRLHTQSDLLRKAKSDIQARAAKSLEQSGVARKESEQAATKIKDALKALNGTRTDLSGPTQEAARSYKQAADAAKKAGTGAMGPTKSATQAVAGAYQQALGDVHATHAFSMAEYAATLQMISAAKPPVPDLSTLADDTSKAKQEFESAAADAKTAYEAALAALTADGKPDDARVNRIKADLGKILDLKPEAPAAPAVEPDAAPAADAGDKSTGASPSAPKMDAAAASAVETEIRTALAAMEPDMKSGDFNGALKHIEFKDPKMKTAIEAILPIAEKGKAFNVACTEKYGKSLVDLVKESKSAAVKSNPILAQFAPTLSGGASLPGAADFPKFLSADSKINVQSPTEAQLSVDGVAEGLTVVKVGGDWKISFDGGPSGAAMMSTMAPMLTAAAGVLEKVTGSIQGGKYADADAMLLDLSAQLMGAMSQGMGAPGGAKKPDGDKPKPPTDPKPSGGG